MTEKATHKQEPLTTLTPDLTQNYLPSERSNYAKIGLWVFMGVVTALFSLFFIAYFMRMGFYDWQALAEPWQLWLSTTMLVLSCIMLHLASRKSAFKQGKVQKRLVVSVVFTIGFVLAQLWAWQQLISLNLVVATNPANSFFYLLTGLHGLHVLGGLSVLAVVMFRLNVRQGEAPVSLPVQLCARYWHFLLFIWLVLLGLLRFT